MMLRHYHINNAVHVYLAELPAEGDKRTREALAKQQLLTEVFGKEVQLLHDEEGKPYLQNSPLSISLSHCRHYLCMAVAEEGIPVGIDIEEIQPRIQRVQHKFLSEQELQHIGNSLLYLTLAWSAKEAVYKIAGRQAGAFGQHISLHTQSIGQDRFPAEILPAEDKYLLHAIEKNEEYVIVLATKA